jgi:hypothetical protein
VLGDPVGVHPAGAMPPSLGSWLSPGERKRAQTRQMQPVWAGVIGTGRPPRVRPKS